MERVEFDTIVRAAARSCSRVHIDFRKEVLIPIHKKYRSVKSVNVFFFEIDVTEKEPLGFGYKIRITDRSGYGISQIPIEQIEKMIPYEEMVDIERVKQQMLSWILRNKDRDVWPTMEEDFETMLSRETRNEITKRFYLKTKLNVFGMARVAEIFAKREVGRFLINDDCYIETDLRQKGYFAWFIDHDTTWLLINPRVAVLRYRR